jgi:hypothetical protein
MNLYEMFEQEPSELSLIAIDHLLSKYNITGKNYGYYNWRRYENWSWDIRFK